MELKDIIHYRRRELGLTLDDIAQSVGVNCTTVQRWESGVIRNLGRDKIAALAAVLRVSPGYLLGWTEDPEVHMEQDLASIVADLTAEEQASVLNYIDFLRAQRKKGRRQ